MEKVLRPLGNNQDISEIAHSFSTKSQILEMCRKKTSTLSQGATFYSQTKTKPNDRAGYRQILTAWKIQLTQQSTLLVIETYGFCPSIQTLFEVLFTELWVVSWVVQRK